ncbi:MAG: transposase [Symploca sp. SIO3E6]|nr:transposase [Caldora sp. SIO3E6]
MNDRLNKIRRVVGVTTKGSKYLLLKNHQDLSETQQEQLEQVLSQWEHPILEKRKNLFASYNRE